MNVKFWFLGARPPWEGSQPPILQQLHKDHFAQQQNYQNYNQQPSTSNRGPPPHGYPPQRSDVSLTLQSMSLLIWVLH